MTDTRARTVQDGRMPDGAPLMTRHLLVAPLAAGALLLAGCSGGDDTEPPRPAGTSSAEASESVASAPDECAASEAARSQLAAVVDAWSQVVASSGSDDQVDELEAFSDAAGEVVDEVESSCPELAALGDFDLASLEFAIAVEGPGAGEAAYDGVVEAGNDLVEALDVGDEYVFVPLSCATDADAAGCEPQPGASR